MNEIDHATPVLREELAILEPILGAWTGKSTGPFGTAQVERLAEAALDGQFIRVTTKSVSATDVHEDVGFFSYDEGRDTVVFREFHNEGYVIRYVLMSQGEGVLKFESENIENPSEPSLRARTAIYLTSPLVETLELSTKGEPFAVCVTVNLERSSHPKKHS